MVELKLKVVYIPVNSPSSVPKQSEEGSPPHEDSNEQASLASTISV